MSVQRIASRYAKSLIDLAVEQNKLDRVLEDVNSFREVLKHREFKLLTKSPIVSTSKKKEIFKAMSSTMTTPSSSITKNSTNMRKFISHSFSNIFYRFKCFSIWSNDIEVKWIFSFKSIQYSQNLFITVYFILIAIILIKHT